MIIVIATIELHDGKREDFLEEFRRIVPLVLQEDGCLDYMPTIDAETDISAQQSAGSQFATIVEKWESVEALKAHLTAPHMLEYRSKVKDFVVGTQLQILEPA